MAKTRDHSPTAGMAGPPDRRPPEKGNAGRHSEKVALAGQGSTIEVTRGGPSPEIASRADQPSDDRQVLGAVVRAKAGDQEAIRYLYCRYSDDVFGYVRSIVRDDHDAET